MDVSWIPGDADLVVVGVAVLAAAGAAWALLRKSRASRTDAQPTTGSVVEPGTEGLTQTGSAIDRPEETQSRFARLKDRLGGGLGASISGLFGKSALDSSEWDELEESLLLADVGLPSTERLIASMRDRMAANGELNPAGALREALLEVLDPTLDRGIDLAPDGELTSVVVVGVNGVGKTTTVGKIARVLVADGHSVVLGAADTFRAAAADQLETWGARVGVPVVRSDKDGADPAAVAFEAAEFARESGASVVLIDTAGRLQNKQGLMDELGKVVRVASKVASPREILLVVDATTGQNGLAQAKVFGQAVGLTGIVLTKLDGTAKGGIVVAVQSELGVPVKFVGLGEGADDLAPFDPIAFVDSLLAH